MTTNSQRFTVRLLGQDNACDSPQHAVSIQKASDIISDLAATDPAEDLYALIPVLLQYGQLKAADQLRHRAKAAAAALP